MCVHLCDAVLTLEVRVLFSPMAKYLVGGGEADTLAQ